MTCPAERSDAGDVGGEEVDSVAVEVPAGAVVAFGGPWVGVPGKDLGVTERETGVEGVCVMMAAWRSECGLMCRGMPAAFATRTTIL